MRRQKARSAFVAAGERDKDGQRDLAVAEIVADALAELGWMRREVEHVVDQLKSDAEIAAKPIERLLLLQRPLGHHRADPACRRKQLCGFCLDDREIGGLGGPRVIRGHQLEHLAFGDHRRGARQDLEDAQRSVGDHQLERSAEQEVADEDRRLVAPDRVGRVTAAPQIARVDDIVVQQGRGVDEFDCSGERDVPASSIAAQPGAAEGEHRPQPLAAARYDIAGELRDQRHRALHALDDQLVDPLQLIAKQPAQRVERWFSASVNPIDTRHQRPRILLTILRIRQPARPIGLTSPNANEHRMTQRPVKSRPAARSLAPRRHRAR